MNRRRGRRVALGAAALVLFVTPATVTVAAGWPNWADIDEREVRSYLDQDAVVLLDEWQITLKGGARIGKRRRVVRVLTGDGVDHAAAIVVRNAFETFRKVRVWVQESNGQVIRYDQDDGTLFTISDVRQLDDVEVLALHPPGISAGCRVAIEYEFEKLADIPQDLFQIQEHVPVIRAAVRLDARGGWRARARVGSGDNPGPELVREEGLWEFQHVPPALELAFALDPPTTTLALDYLPPGEESPFHDWASTANWARGLFGGAQGKQPLLERAVDEVRRSGDDPVDQVGQQVRKLRYFAIEVGWGALRPRTPETTLARGFGDCKDKSHLMVTMLERLGIEAFPILVSAPADHYIDPALSGPGQFNHAVVGIPWEDRDSAPGMAIADSPDLGRVRIFDPTLSDASPQDIDIRLEEALGLPLHERSRLLLEFPRSSATENRVERDYEWWLEEDGIVRNATELRFSGATRAWLEGEGGELLDRDELREQTYAKWSSNLPGFEELDVSEIRVLEDGTWGLSVSCVQPDALYSFGDLRVMDLPPLRPQAGRMDKVEVPVDSPLLLAVRQTDRVHLGTYGLVEAPSPIDVETDFGRVSLRFAVDDGLLFVEREVSLASLEFDEDWEAAGEQLERAVRRIDRVSLILAPTGGTLAAE